MDVHGIKQAVAIMLWVLAISCFAVGVGIGVFIVKAWAHSWYPIECCSGNDCDVVLNMGKAPNVMVTTKHGTALLTEETKRHESKDEKVHACIRGGKLVCIFFPKSV